MSVPAIDTTKIATFAWWKQAGVTQVTLADCLGILHSYNQYSEYIDGVIKIFDTGSVSSAPDNYVLVNVRIRKDGYILAWFNRELTPGNQTVVSATTTTLTGNFQIQNYHDTAARSIVADELAGNTLEFTSGALSGNKYTIQSNTTTTITLHDKYGDNVSTDVSSTAGDTFRIYSSRGNLVWWGHTSSVAGNPTNQSTRLGRAIYEIWEQLKANQVGGSGASLSYSEVNYYDYEYTNATYMYILGFSGSAWPEKYYHYTIPYGTTVYETVFNIGGDRSTLSGSDSFYYNGVLKLSVPIGTRTNGFQNRILSSNIGIQNTIHLPGEQYYASSAVIILTS